MYREYDDQSIQIWENFMNNFEKQNELLAEFHKPKMEKPNRDQVINVDDINNLRIAMHTCKSIDEFIAVI